MDRGVSCEFKKLEWTEWLFVVCSFHIPMEYCALVRTKSEKNKKKHKHTNCAHARIETRLNRRDNQNEFCILHPTLLWIGKRINSCSFYNRHCWTCYYRATRVRETRERATERMYECLKSSFNTQQKCYFTNISIRFFLVWRSLCLQSHATHFRDQTNRIYSFIHLCMRCLYLRLNFTAHIT